MKGVVLKAPVVILVEGPDEVNFLIELCKARSLPTFPALQFIPYEGKTQLGDFLRTVTKLPGYSEVTSVGIVRDADSDAGGAVQSVKAAFKNAGLKASATELALHNGPPRTAFLILPGGGATGELEDCLLSSVAGHAALPCIDTLLQCVAQRRGTPCRKISKARARAMLAIQEEEPLNLIGDGARAGVWPLTHQAFDGLANLITLLAT